MRIPPSRSAMRFALAALAAALAAPMALAQYDDLYNAGVAKMQNGKHAEARQDLEQAARLAASAAQRAQAQTAIAQSCLAQRDFAAARAAFDKVVQTQGLAPDQRLSAQMSIANCWERESADKAAEGQKAFLSALVAYSKAADIEGASPQQECAATMAAAQAFMAARKHDEAAAVLRTILLNPDSPPAGKALAQLALGQCLFRERRYALARHDLSKAMTMSGLTDSNRAEARLTLGLCFEAEQDYDRARTEFNEVLATPGADPRQTHEARLRLCLRKLNPPGEKVLTVLFIGASQTQVFNVPQIVETLAASAPAGAPRIITGGFLRGGTGIQSFWEEGQGPGTARDMIASAPWDCVVFETHLIFGRDIFTKYATRFAGFIRAHRAVPVFYQAPAFIRHEYPAEFQRIHDETLGLARSLKVTVAPARYAWMQILGPAPTPAQRKALYHPDEVHPSKRGAYLVACAVYSAVTGLSPVGLTHSIPSFAPEGMAPEEAAELQQTAWDAFLETKAALQR